MKKHILSLYALALLCIGGVTATSCSDPEEVQDLALARVLSPTNLSARVSNDVNIIVSWDEMSGATSYELEAYADSPDYDQTPYATGSSTEATYTFVGLEGETTYYIRVRALDETDASRTSLWSTIERATNAEQIFTRVAEADLTESSVILRWPAGEYATVINIYKGSGTDGEQVKSHQPITDSEISEGAVTITGLEPETLYTAKMLNGTKTRGQIEFTTRIDLGGATQVDEGDDLAAMLDVAEEGESFVIMSGEFNLGTYSLTKSISISGYSSENKPVINGNFEVASGVTIESLTLGKLTLNGLINGERVYAYTVSAKGGLDKLNISDCDITGYKSGVIYNNSAATLGDIVIDNCLVTDILGSGGDGLDLRAGGTLGSLTVTNSTFYNGFRSFLRCQVSTGSPAISFTNCTFCNITTGDVGKDNTGLFRTASDNTSLIVKNCLFYQICKVDENDRTGSYAGIWARTDIKGTENYANNYYFDCPYLWMGKYASGHDDVATESDPGFVDPENGDFTMTNAILIDDKVGDPRWY